MKMEPRAALGHVPAQHGMRRFAVLLAVALLALCALVRPKHFGDIAEYMLTTVAVANHGTPDIRPGDVEDMLPLMPYLAPVMRTVAQGMQAGAQVPLPGLLRTEHGYYAIHFFAYPALAALPFKLLKALGLDPFKCYQVINSAALFVLGLALFRLFGNGRRAALGLLCYLLCGGGLYWQWSSPETFSAASLLAALALYSTGAPLAGGLLAGLGAMQNPPILFFCVFAPLLRASLAWQNGEGLGTNLRQALGRRELLGAALCGVLALLPALFDLAVFGTPSIIGAVATDPRLVSGRRLLSFFFDLNQGLVVGLPALVAALLLWRQRCAATLRVSLAAAAFSVTMALPSLVATNWNSAAEGMMRYALWAGMPLVFAFAWRLRDAPRWPTAVVALVLALQALAMVHLHSYSYVGFSPLARLVMKAAPSLYNPEPEIFVERVEGTDGFNDYNKVFAWPAAGKPSKILYNLASPTAPGQLCAAGTVLVHGPDEVDAGVGWRYTNGQPLCVPAGA
jgi:hypothetical protein